MFIELNHPTQGPTYINVSTIHEVYPVYDEQGGTVTEPVKLSLSLDRGAGSPMEFGYGTYRTREDAEQAYRAVSKALGGIAMSDLQRGARAGM